MHGCGPVWMPSVRKFALISFSDAELCFIVIDCFNFSQWWNEETLPLLNYQYIWGGDKECIVPILYTVRSTHTQLSIIFYTITFLGDAVQSNSNTMERKCHPTMTLAALGIGAAIVGALLTIVVISVAASILYCCHQIRKQQR